MKNNKFYNNSKWINIKEVIKKKLVVNFKKYKILGVCNPSSTIEPLKTRLKIEFAIITALHAMILLSSCGNSERNQKPAELEKPIVENNDDHNQAAHEHSQLMSDTREWLKNELGDKYNEPISVATESQLKQGKEIYTKHCASCHGNSGKGDGELGAQLNPKPADFTDFKHATYYSELGRIYIIKKGIRGTAMAGWENTINEQEIISVYAFVNSFKNLTKTEEQENHNH